MTKKVNFNMFKYFLENYFNVSANYDELEELVNEFNFENIEYRKSLHTELKTIKKQQNWNFIHELVREIGMRKMNKDQLEWLIQYILDNLKTE